jgi:S-formylglutathione hydrolase FrmB
VPFVELTVESEALRGNPLGDPHVRRLHAWVPRGDGRWPAVYVLHAFTNQLRSWFNVSAFAPTFPERIEALAPECVVVLVDAWTALGGSQFVDSALVGRYHTYLCDEVVPSVDALAPSTGVRALHGHSSGGYGAMVNAMLRPDLFHGFASHAGDALFDVTLRRDFPEAARALRAYDGSFARFLEDFRSRRPFARRSDHTLIMTWALASIWSGGEPPFDVETGVVREDVFARWLAWDPVRMAQTHADALRGLRAIWVDAGLGDEFFLDLGAVAFREALRAAGVAEERVFFELHEGGHSGNGWRFLLSLAWLAERLAAQ